MRRRDFIKAITAAAWPLAARAQQDGLRLIGMVSGLSEDEMRPLLAVFRSRLSQLGWTEGRNFAIDARLGAGDYPRMTEEAGALVGRNPDVIVAQGTPGLTAVLEQSRTVPVVFTLVADPVSQHLIASLAKPGGNATGFTNFEFSIGTKWLELLKEISPSLSHVTLIANPANPAAKPLVHVVEETGRAIAVTVSTAFVHGSDDIQAAISTGAHQSGGGIIVLPDSLTVIHSGLIIALAERYRLPAIYAFRTFAAKGGLLTYGLDIPEIYRQAADYVDRILRGEKPADLPVQAPTKFELIVNLKTAKALGLKVPVHIQQIADELIE